MKKGTSSEIEKALALLGKEAGLSSQTLSALRAAIETNKKEEIDVPIEQAPINDDTLDDAAARRPFKPASSKKQQLTAEEAVEIYKLRPKPGAGGNLRRGSMMHCKQIAPKYGVTPKTIRDVWSGRSWVDATRHLWTKDEEERRASHDDKSNSSGSTSPAPPMSLHADQGFNAMDLSQKLFAAQGMVGCPPGLLGNPLLLANQLGQPVPSLHLSSMMPPTMGLNNNILMFPPIARA